MLVTRSVGVPHFHSSSQCVDRFFQGLSQPFKALFAFFFSEFAFSDIPRDAESDGFPLIVDDSAAQFDRNNSPVFMLMGGLEENVSALVQLFDTLRSSDILFRPVNIC